MRYYLWRSTALGDDELDNSLEETEAHLRPGINLLRTSHVARRERANPRIIQRWLDKGRPTYNASLTQIGALVSVTYSTI